MEERRAAGARNRVIASCTCIHYTPGALDGVWTGKDQRPHWSSHFSQGSARSDAVVVGLFLLFSRSQTVSTSGRVIVRSDRIVRAMPLSRSCLCGN